MMNKKFLPSLLVTVLLFPLLAHAQKIDSMMNIYAENYQQEKIYVHFDKSVYNPGETIWYKAYLFAGSFPSLQSLNFYTELTDADGNILQQRSAPLLESTASGYFELPANIKVNRVHFRAYTTWMLNFDTAFLFEKEIRILNTPKDSVKPQVVSTERYLQFFPESGDMVAGLESNIAFKANDASGMPIEITGTLRDAKGNNIIDFKSEHDGMGKFLITPDKGDALYATWKDDLGQEHKTDLPPVKASGVVLKLIPAEKKVFFSVARSADSLQKDNNHLTIIGHMHQHLVYKAKMNLEENFMSGGSIPVSQLPSGILTVTVFNNLDQPVAERVVFVNNHDYEFMPELSITSKSLVKRGHNEIEIYVPDSLRSNLSVSITDEEADGNKPNDDNIISRLLLTGDLKGYVHNPYFYFSNSADSTLHYLDLVMMTHGWRRYKWDQVLLGKVPTIKVPEQNYLAARVQVLGVLPSQISKDEVVSVILKKKDSSVQMLQVPHLAGDKFGISGIIFYDTATAYYQFNTNRQLSNQAAILFTNGLYKGNKKVKPMKLPYINWTRYDSAMLRKNRIVTSESFQNEILKNQKVSTLQQVTVRAKEKTAAQKLSEKYTTGMFATDNAFTFDLVNDKIASAFPDILTYLQGKVAGLQISNAGNTTTLSWRGSKPTLYMNEMQSDVDQVKNTPVSDIALIKVFPPGSGIGIGGSPGGTIAIYTKRGGDTKNDESFKGLDRARIVGYSPQKEFYSPNYAQESPDNLAADIRTTLYWNPHLLTDKHNRRLSFQFYNNDITKKIRIVLEGINEDGKLARVEKSLE